MAPGMAVAGTDITAIDQVAPRGADVPLILARPVAFRCFRLLFGGGACLRACNASTQTVKSGYARGIVAERHKTPELQLSGNW